MLVGDPTSFAIESQLTTAYQRLSFRALGYFVLHIRGMCYGVRDPEATLLACSLDGVDRRLASPGHHTAPFAAHPDAGAIAEAFRSAIYDEPSGDRYFGLSASEFAGYFSRVGHDVMWAPDGDQAFDDGSYVLQFDIGDMVRLIAFRSTAGTRPDPDTINELWLPQTGFYGTLQLWRDSFESLWQSMPKQAG